MVKHMPNKDRNQTSQSYFLIQVHTAIIFDTIGIVSTFLALYYFQYKKLVFKLHFPRTKFKTNLTQIFFN